MNALRSDVQPAGMNRRAPQVICCHHEGCRPVGCRVLDHLHMGNDALNPLCLAVRAIMTRTLCQIHHMACLCLHHATNNASRVSSHDGWWRQSILSKDCRWLSKKCKTWCCQSLRCQNTTTNQNYSMSFCPSM